MADDTPVLFLSSWGDIRLFMSAIEWQDGETQVVHDLAAGDVHPVQPRGSRIKTAKATLVFDAFEGAKETGIDAYRRFKATTKERRIFTHPEAGSYFAVIGDLSPAIDESSVIKASCEFIPDEEVEPVSPTGAGTSTDSGEASVAAAADILASQLSAQGVGFQPEAAKKIDFSKPIDQSIPEAFAVDANASANLSVQASLSANVSVSAKATASATASVRASASASAFAFANAYASAQAVASATAVAEASAMASATAFAFAYACSALDADARSSVASWSDEDVAARQIIIDATRISESIALMIEVGGFERDLVLWPAFRAAIMLGDAIRSAVVAATSETPSVFIMRVQRRTALLPLAAKIYGGREAQARARQIAGLNDIRTVGWLEPGDYTMPTRPTSSLSPLLVEAE